MAHDFANRLDFVMGVTQTTNSSLARALSFDASYICRIRNGKRGLPLNQPFIEPAAAYLASRVSDPRQKRALADELGRNWPSDMHEATDALAKWLASNKGGAPAVGKAVAMMGRQDGMSADAGTGMDEHADQSDSQSFRIPPASPPNRQTSFHYGNEGKREAVLAFLGRICETGEPHTLLLHSDEDMTWLYEDEEFTRRWTALLLRLIGNGGRIRIIHAVSRDANEMWEAVSKWMPLYMTGAIEPYYYPRLRDGVYRRTLFVARGNSAIASTSIGQSTSDGLNMLTCDTDAVAALEREFTSYLALCQPLMRASFPDDGRGMATLISKIADDNERLLAALEGATLVCTWNETRAFVANTTDPLVAFEIAEPRMASAVWEYLHNLPEGATSRDSDACRLLVEIANNLGSR